MIYDLVYDLGKAATIVVELSFKKILLITSIGATVGIAVALWPYFNALAPDELNALAQEFVDKRPISGQATGPIKIAERRSINPFVAEIISGEITLDGNRIVSDNIRSRRLLNYDVIITMAGLTIFMLASLPLLRPDKLAKDLTYLQKSIYDGFENIIASAREVNKDPAEAILLRDVALAYGRASSIYTRSTLLLVGGVVMSFVGVVTFFVTIGDVNLYSISGELRARPRGLLGG